MVFNPIPEFFGNSLTQLNQKTTNIYDQETVTRIVAEAVKAEREACAKVCGDLMFGANPYERWEGMKWCMDRIKARGEA